MFLLAFMLFSTPFPALAGTVEVGAARLTLDTGLGSASSLGSLDFSGKATTPLGVGLISVISPLAPSALSAVQSAPTVIENPSVITAQAGHPAVIQAARPGADRFTLLLGRGVPAPVVERLRTAALKASETGTASAHRQKSLRFAVEIMDHFLGDDLARRLSAEQRADLLLETAARAVPGAEAFVPAHGDARWRRRMQYAEEVSSALSVAETATAKRRVKAARALQRAAADPDFAWLSPAAREAVFSAMARLGVPRNARSLPDSAVEFEIKTDKNMLDALTTEDGTIDALSRLTKRGARGGTPRSLLLHPGVSGWKTVPVKVRKALIEESMKSQGYDFWHERAIRGLKVDPHARVTFSEAVTFRGETIPAGESVIDVSEVLREGVESAGPGWGADSVEIHYRDGGAAGTVAQDAWRFLDGIGVKRRPGHVHIVAPLPIGALEQDPEEEAARLADYYRRVNLFAEMMTVVEQKMTIIEKKSLTVQYFGFLTRDALMGVADYLESVGYGSFYHIDSEYKMAWVGFWGADKYDQSRRFGFEFRSLRPDTDLAIQRQLLDRTQRGLLEEDYGIRRDVFRAWLASRRKAGFAPKKALSAAWYHDDWKELWRRAKRGPSSWARLWWRRLRSGQEEKMLWFDWEHEPGLFGKPLLRRRIHDVQREYQRRAAAGEKAEVRDFLLESGLYAAIGRSLGVVVR